MLMPIRWTDPITVYKERTHVQYAIIRLAELDLSRMFVKIEWFCANISEWQP